MKTYQFFDAVTGIFAPHSYSGSPDQLAVNTPAGYVAFDCSVYPTGWRMDVATGQLTLSAPVAAVADVAPVVAACVVAYIAQIEAGQVRALRETLLALAGGKAPLAATVAALKAQDDTIAAARPAIAAARAAVTFADLQAAQATLPAVIPIALVTPIAPTPAVIPPEAAIVTPPAPPPMHPLPPTP